MNESQHLKRGEYAYASGFKESVADYTSRIGFDLVKCKVYLLHIDWTILDKIIGDSSGKIEILSDSPKDHIQITISDKSNPPLSIPGNSVYSSIQIKYQDFQLRLQTSNIRPLKGEKKSDISQLSVYVTPKIPCLGNLNNHSLSELQERVLDIFDLLECYGLYFDRSVATVNYFEINRNHPYQGRFFIDYFKAAFATLPDSFRLHPKRTPWGTLGVVDDNGIFAEASTISLHVYDKVLETEEKYKNVYIDEPKIYRVEFVVKKEKQVKSWLKESNLFKISQEDVIAAYYRYLDKYVIIPFKNQIRRLYEHMSWENKIDTSKRHWTDAFCQDLILDSKKLNINPGFITYDDIKAMLMESKNPSQTIKMNLSRSLNLIVSKAPFKTLDDTDYESVITGMLTDEEKTFTVHYQELMHH